MNSEYGLPGVPAYITVHLGKADEIAENVTVSFPDYIKSVASTTLPPDIPEEALCAVMYAQISRALYRISERIYRKMGYGFDITDNPDTDLAFEYNGAVFSNVNEIADRIFNEYIAGDFGIWPLNAEICYNGVTCRGISVEGSIAMAENGRTCEEILEYYFGRKFGIVRNATVRGLQNFFLFNYPMYQGQTGSDVSGLQIALNRIAANYEEMPYIKTADGVYGEDTVMAVSKFQRIFDLPISGNVEKNTYYKLLYVFDSIYKLNYLALQMVEFSDIPTEPPTKLKYGDVGNQVKLLQYYLNFISAFEPSIPPLQIVGVFGEKTYRSVVSFQEMFGFEPDGVVTEPLWRVLVDVYYGLYSSLPHSVFSETARPYGGNILVSGSVGIDVRYLQKYLAKVAEINRRLPEISLNGKFDEQTENAVRVFQQIFRIKESGVVTSTTWNLLSEVYNAIVAGEQREED
ncbi:MAG: peptidoglycan-binding protein [Clostridia bacterium]|nr:peptidoglycan-binding protein [Clostridia bacterium]